MTLHAPTVLLTYGLGAAGGLAANWAGLPLPMLLGPLVVVGLAAVLGARPLGHLPQVPMWMRQLFLPVLGVAIGSSFSPEVLSGAGQWLVSLLVLALFVPLVHFAGYRMLRATGQVDPVTAYFGTAPGGLIDAVQMGEEMGADPRLLVLLQFLRLILTIILVPIAFTFISGHSVGSASGLQLGGLARIGFGDAAILTAAGILGAALGVVLRFPAAWMTGPLLLSSLVHGMGLTVTAPPPLLVMLTQIVIGTTLGTRFAGTEPRLFLTGLKLAALNLVLTGGCAAAIAFLLAGFVGEPVSAVFLAFAPGGLAEMSLIALSLELSVIYVTAHHVLRIVLAILVIRLFAHRIPR